MIEYIFIGILIIAIIIGFILYSRANAESSVGNFREEQRYTGHLNTIATRFESAGDTRRPVTELLATGVMLEVEQCLVNFNVLGCRFTGYLGPFDQGYFDPEKAILYSVKAGCRCFVLEIDYIDECKGETISYYPRIVVRDENGRIRMKANSNKPICNSVRHSNISTVCNYINEYAFGSMVPNSSDPVIIVLYFLRTPPGNYKSKAVLDYYSNVAKGLSAFNNRLVTNELEGGNFYRQKQEGRLLINRITDYNNKVLIFSNANTNGFRDVKTYAPMEDLDYLVNLRMAYSQTKLGVTENLSGASYGILDTAESYSMIPSDRIEDVADSTKLRWTLCLSSDPSKPVSADLYKKIGKIGVQCVPIHIFDPSNGFMFTDKTFKTYSYIPKPESLRYIKPPIVIPGEPNPTTNAKHGKLRAPVVEGG